MAEVVEINELAELDRYQLLWSSLLGETREATFFQSLSWLRCYWRSFGEGQKLRVLIVYRQGRPLGIVPLVVRQEVTRLGSLRVLTYPLADWGSFYGPIGPHPAATLASAMKYLAGSRRDWDLLDLRWIDEQRVDRGRTSAAMRLAGFAARESMWKTSALVEMDSTWGEYLGTRTSKFRNSLKRHERRVAELGEIEFVRYRPEGSAVGDDDPRWDLFEQCVELSRRSWQASASDGTTLCHEAVEPFLRDAHAAAVKEGAADLNLLYAGGTPLAFAYNYHCRGSVYGLRIGYDMRYSKLGAGNVLYSRSIEDSHARGDRFLDMGIGSLEIKRHWLTREISSFRATHYAPAGRAQLLRLKHWLAGRFAARSRGEAVSA